MTSVVVPTYRERQTIGATLRALDDELAGDDEIIVVDDSPDERTAEAVRVVRRSLAAEVRLVERDEGGLGSAIVDGLRAATDDVVVVLDADGQHPPARVPDLVGAVADGADVAVGTRESVPDEWGLSRRVVSRVAAALARVSIPAARPLGDPMSGFFAVDKASVELGPETRTAAKGWKALLAVLATSEDPSAAEVPYRFRERQGGESSLDAAAMVGMVDQSAILRAASLPGLRRRPVAVARSVALAAGAAAVAVLVVGAGSGIHAVRLAAVAVVGAVYGWTSRDVLDEVIR